MMCPHFGVCGGCSRQDRSYADQLSDKEASVLARLAGLTIGRFHKILPSPDIWFYRNKMEFSFGNEKDIDILERSRDRTDGFRSKARATASASQVATSVPPAAATSVHLGLHPKGRFALVTPTPECRLLSEESQKICAVIESWAMENGISVYVRKSGEGDLRHLVFREGKNTGDRLVNLVSKSSTPKIDELACLLKDSNLPISTFIWTAYDGLSDVARGEERKIFWGEGRITEKIGDLTFQVNPESFTQTNTRAAESLLRVLSHWSGAGAQTLIDLYCGSGMIGLSLAKDYKEVIGVEINRSAILDAEENAHANRISNAHFMEGKAEEIAGQFPVQTRPQSTTVVVDPPRAGLHPRLVEVLLRWSVPRLFYVSCNPETLARDLRALSGRYDILDVQPMDFFPHTDHVETAVRLQLSS